MGTEHTTRPQILLALRRWKPRMSLRRLGDMINGAQLHVVEAKTESSAMLAFGIVLDGTLLVRIGEEQWLLGPGEVFGMSQYAVKEGNSPVSLRSTTGTVRYLGFSHDDVATLGFARARPVST